MDRIALQLQSRGEGRDGKKMKASVAGRAWDYTAGVLHDSAQMDGQAAAEFELYPNFRTRHNVREAGSPSAAPAELATFVRAFSRSSFYFGCKVMGGEEGGEGASSKT